MQNIRKPKTRRGKKFLESLEQEPVDGNKRCILISEPGCSSTVTDLLRNIAALKNPDAEFIKFRSKLAPFNDPTHITKYCTKSNHHIFITGSSSKKRPDNITIGRFYDHEILDMYEFHVRNYQEHDKIFNMLIDAGQKPAVFFLGHDWEYDPNAKHIKNIFADLWCHKGLEYILPSYIKFFIVFALGEDSIIHMRCFRKLKTKIDENVVEDLYPIGVSIDLEMRRVKLPDEKIFKIACKKEPKKDKIKTEKNITYDNVGAKTGAIHMAKQSLDTLKVTRPKALKRKNAKISSNVD